MNWDIIELKVLHHLCISVRFRDGTEGLVRFMPSHLIGVFSPLKDPQFFSMVFIESGALTWPNDIDIAPDAMYAEIKAHGEWVLI